MTDHLQLLLRQTAKPCLIQMTLANEPGKNQEKARVAIVEYFVDLLALLAQIVFDGPHVRWCLRCSSPRLELGHKLRKPGLEGFLIGTTCDLLLGGRPSKIVHSTGGASPPDSAG